MMLCFGCCNCDSFDHCNKIHTVQVHHVAKTLNREVVTTISRFNDMILLSLAIS